MDHECNKKDLPRIEDNPIDEAVCELNFL